MLPRWLQVAQLRVRSLFRRSAMERELERELRAHIDLQVEEYVAGGMTVDAARRAALREFGGVARFQDDVRDTWGVAIVDDVRRDLRYAWRGLRRRPLLVAVSVMSIGLGVCVNATVFALANTLFLAPPTAREADRLVHIRMAHGSHVSYDEWRALDATGALRGLAGYQIEAVVNWLRGDAAVTVAPLVVTANFFDVLGIPVARGRAFDAREARAELDPRVVVLSDGFWRAAFGADSAIVGRAMTLNARAYTIVGVLAPHIRGIAGYGSAPEVYLPLSRTLVPELDVKTASTVQLVGRLHDGQTISQGRVSLTTAARHADVVKAAGDSASARVGLFSQARGLSQGGAPRTVAGFLVVLFIIVVLIMAIACANVTGLLLARNAERRREIALRLALGAGRWRLVRQLLAEGLWLAVLGTAGGLVLAWPVMRLINGATLPFPVPIELYLTIDPAVIGYALAMVAAACVMSALVPALEATHVAVSPALKGEARTVLYRRFTLRRVLATGQVAVSLMLLVTAMLFVRNLRRAQVVDAGFDAAHTVMAQVAFVQDRYSREARDAMIAATVDRVRAIPGVGSAAVATGVPLTLRSGRTTGTSITIDGEKEPVSVSYHGSDVGPEYFATMGMGLLRGREFLETDARGAAPVAVVNAEFARRYFSGRDAIGRIIDLPGPKDPIPTEVIGVVSNAKHRTVGEEITPAVYEPFAQRRGSSRVVFVVARATGNPETILDPLRRAIGQLDPSTAVDVRAMRSALTFAFLPSRIGAVLVGSLGVLGLALAMIGLFGVISFGASRRVREIAIRMSLGASRPSVMRLVLREAAAVTGAGMALGALASVAVSRPLAAFLVDGLSVHDPLSYATTAVTLAVVALVAGWIPAWRAARIDPMVVLRRD